MDFSIVGKTLVAAGKINQMLHPSYRHILPATAAFVSQPMVLGVASLVAVAVFAQGSRKRLRSDEESALVIVAAPQPISKKRRCTEKILLLSNGNTLDDETSETKCATPELNENLAEEKADTAERDDQGASSIASSSLLEASNRGTAEPQEDNAKISEKEDEHEEEQNQEESGAKTAKDQDQDQEEEDAENGGGGGGEEEEEDDDDDEDGSEEDALSNLHNDASEITHRDRMNAYHPTSPSVHSRDEGSSLSSESSGFDLDEEHQHTQYHHAESESENPERDEESLIDDDIDDSDSESNDDGDIVDQHSNAESHSRASESSSDQANHRDESREEEIAKVMVATVTRTLTLDLSIDDSSSEVSNCDEKEDNRRENLTEAENTSAQSNLAPALDQSVRRCRPGPKSAVSVTASQNFIDLS